MPSPLRLPEMVDVAVVGAGTAGAAAAACIAQGGLSVACLERGPLERAGARWVNAVPAWVFDAADLPQPTGEELLGRDEPLHLLAGWGPERVVVRGHGMLDLDMRLLVARLQDHARDRGAQLLGDTRVEGAHQRSDGVELVTDRGTVRASWVVDASGLAGAGLVPRRRLSPRHICVAAQQLRAVRDLPAARAYFEQHEVPPGETLCFSGIEGGYSIINLRLIGDRISLLTGSIPGDGHPSGVSMLRTFVDQQSWIGAEIFGGSRAIPVRRTHGKLVHGRVAVIGDAASQVLPAHGSGIGPGLLAARILARSLERGGGLSGYAVDWHREHGGVMSAYDAVRRFCQELDQTEVRRLFGLGLISENLLWSGMVMRPPRPRLQQVAALATCAVQNPRLATRVSGLALRVTAAQALQQAYPSHAERRHRWARLMAGLFATGPVSCPA